MRRLPDSETTSGCKPAFRNPKRKRGTAFIVDSVPRIRPFTLRSLHSREATTANSRGRKPTENLYDETEAAKRRQQFAQRFVLSPLRGFRSFCHWFCGLTPAATCCRHFVARQPQAHGLRVGLLPGMAPREDRRGYTLAEMIIAMVLVSALMSTVWGIMSLYNGLLTAGRDRANGQQLVRSLFEILHEDLSAVNAYAETPLLSEFGDTFDELTSSDDTTFDFAMPQMQPQVAPSGQLSLSGSATAMRLQVRSFVPPDLSPPSDIDLLNELGGGSASRQQSADRVSEFQTIVYQIVPWGQTDSVNADSQSLSPGMYRIQVDAQSLSALEAGQSTAEQLRQTDSIEVSRLNLIALSDPQPDSAGDLLNTERLSDRTAPEIHVDAVPEVVKCRFEYFDGATWQSSWNKNQTRRLPVAVRVSLDIVEGKELARLQDLYPSRGVKETDDENTSITEPEDDPNSYAVSARRFSRTILLDSTAAVASGGSR